MRGNLRFVPNKFSYLTSVLASEYYHKKPHELPSVERKEDYLTNQNDLLDFSLAPSCGIQQRLQTNEGLQRYYQIYK